MAAWTDLERNIQIKAEFDWPKTSTWTDESSRVLSASGKQSMLLPAQLLGGSVEQPPWTCRLTMRNNSSRFNPLYSSGALYSNIQKGKFYGVPVRVEVGLWNGSSYDYTRVFTGHIKSINVTSEAESKAVILCDDNTQPFYQHYQSDNMETDQRTDQYLTILKNLAGVGTIDFDTGLNTVPYCWIDEERLWNEINEVAHSEGGRVYFDRNGTLVFKNAESWLVDTVHTASQHTFSTTRIGDVALPFDWKGTYNGVLVPYKLYREIGIIQVFRLKKAFVLLPGETRSFTAKYSKAVQTTSTPAANNQYVAIDQGGNDLSGSISVVGTYHGQRADISITNNHATSAITITRFNLFGDAIDGAQVNDEPKTTTNADIGTSTTKVYRLSTNAYIQATAHSEFLANMLLGNLEVGRQMYRVSRAKAIPALEPGYRVTIPTIDAGNFQAFLTNINWTFDGGEYTASYDAIDADEWFPQTDYHSIGDLFSANKKAWF